MNAPIAPEAGYATSAYRSNAIPSQPPHKWSQDANRTGPTRAHLRWGHYANLEPWQDVDAQLRQSKPDYLNDNQEDDLYIVWRWYSPDS